MISAKNQLFRKVALDRVASPGQLDERLVLVSYRPWVRIALPILLVIVLAYATWFGSTL